MSVAAVTRYKTLMQSKDLVGSLLPTQLRRCIRTPTDVSGFQDLIVHDGQALRLPRIRLALPAQTAEGTTIIYGEADHHYADGKAASLWRR